MAVSYLIFTTRYFPALTVFEKCLWLICLHLNLGSRGKVRGSEKLPKIKLSHQNVNSTYPKPLIPSVQLSENILYLSHPF